MKKLLLLVDGNALFHRAYHALPPLTVRKTGEIVNAVYGFASMLLKAINELKPSHFAVAFDRKEPTFRHILYKGYKVQRPPTPDELVCQLGRLRQLVDAFNMPVFEIEGFEADDILGALSEQADEQGMETVIVTGDADTMQLVSPHTKVLYPKPKRPFSDTMLYNEAAVSERFGVRPEHIADLKALVGDKSDNIPGVTGIGDKTAVKLIQEFGSIDEIYRRIAEVKPEKLRDLLLRSEDIARQSKKLATIVCDLPVRLNLGTSGLGRIDRQKLSDLFRELEFSTLLPRLNEALTDISEMPAPTIREPACRTEYSVVCSAGDLEALTGKIRQKGSFSFDTETTGLDPMAAGLVGISISLEPGKAYYFPVGHTCLEAVTQLPLDNVTAGLRAVFEDENLPKTAHNANFDITALAQHGIETRNFTFDTMVAAHLLGEQSLGLKALAFSRIGVEMTPITDLIGTGAKQICISNVEISRTLDYACADADMTGRLADIFSAELKEQGLWRLFSEVEMPLVPVLVRMERNGVALDAGLLHQQSRRLGERLLELEKAIYDCVGHRFNINSPQQLSPVLFQELKLPSSTRTKCGYSTGASVLEDLRGTHPVVDLILEYRQLAKLKSTYIDALPEMVNPKTGRLHTSLNQTRTATGRLSSSDPNLQNIPIRTQQGREIRQAFISPPGSSLLSGDYSQIDLRALAHLSQDPALLETFHRDGDIHTDTAARLFNVEPSGVTSDMRRLSKTVNFGVIYGMSGYGLEQATELSREESEQFIDAYFKKYPGVKDYLDKTRQQARQLGYVQTILGRKRTIPEVNSHNRNLREAAERMAINMPVQGTSADIIKVAMVNLDREMTSRNLMSKLLLQVHDELILEVPDDELEEMKTLVRHVMSTAIPLSIPLKVDIKTGSNWGQLE